MGFVIVNINVCLWINSPFIFFLKRQKSQRGWITQGRNNPNERHFNSEKHIYIMESRSVCRKIRNERILRTTSNRKVSLCQRDNGKS